MDTTTFQFWGTIAALVLGLISALPKLASFTSWVGNRLGGRIGRWLTLRLLFVEEAKKDESFAAIYVGRQLATAIFALTIMITFEFAGVETEKTSTTSKGGLVRLIETTSYAIELACTVVVAFTVGTIGRISRKLLWDRVEIESEEQNAPSQTKQ